MSSLDKLLDWRIYYGDGSVFSNKDGQSFEAPKWGAVVIVQQDPTTNHTVLSGPWFYYWNCRWWATDNDGGVGFIDKIVNFVNEIEAVLPGRWIGDKEWNEILIRAQNDPDFLPRSAFKPNDRRPK